VVPLLFAKYAGEVVKALPSDKAYPPRGSENARSILTTARLARRSRPLEVSNMQFNGDGETRSYVNCE